MTVDWKETKKLYLDLSPSLQSVDDLIDLWWIPATIWFFDINIPLDWITELPSMIPTTGLAETAAYFFVFGAGVWGFKNLVNYGNPLWIPDGKEYKERGEWYFLNPKRYTP